MKKKLLLAATLSSALFLTGARGCGANTKEGVRDDFRNAKSRVQEVKRQNEKNIRDAGERVENAQESAAEELYGDTDTEL